MIFTRVFSHNQVHGQTLVIGLMERRVARFQGVRNQWARFLSPIVAGIAALTALIVAAVLPTSSTVVLLDITGFCGPGPLPTQLEQRFRDLTGLPILVTWTIVFFGKFWILAAVIGASVAAAAWMLRERQAT